MEKLPGVNGAHRQCKQATGTITAIFCNSDLEISRCRSQALIYCLVGLLAGLVGWGGWSDPHSGRGHYAIAVEPAPATSTANPNLLPSTAPLDVAVLKMQPLPAPLRSATTISPVSLTIPSLWWTEDHHASQDPSEAKLVENWLAYPLTTEEPGRVDVVVNRQLWSLLDYLERYEFINEFGNSARDFGYNLRIFDNRAKLLGAYTCDFSSVALTELKTAQRSLQLFPANDSPDITISTLPYPTTLTCDVFLDASGKAGFRGR